MNVLVMILASAFATEASPVEGGARHATALMHGARPTSLDDIVPGFDLQEHSILAPFGSMDLGPNDDWIRRLSYGVIYSQHPEIQLRAMKRISIHLASATVREVLDSLVAADTSYFWIQDAGVVNFLPLTTSYATSVMEQKLGYFEAMDMLISEASGELSRQAHVQGLEGLAVRRASQYSDKLSGEFTDESVALSLSSHTVRECLNRIVAADPPARWEAIPFPQGMSIQAVAKHGHLVLRRKLTPQERSALERRYQGPFPKSETPPEIFDGFGEEPR